MVTKLKKSTCSAADDYVPKLWCYKELQYCAGVDDDIAGESNISSLDATSGENEHVECDELKSY